MLLVVIPQIAAAQDQVVDRIVARVNGDVITLFDLNDRVRIYVTQVLKKDYNPNDPAVKELQKQMLTTLIEDLLIRQEAKHYKLSVSDNEIEGRIRELRKQNGNMSEAQFVQQLRLEGMTRQQFMESMRKNMLKEQLIGYMVQRKIVVGEDEIKAYYEAHKNDLSAQASGQRLGIIVVNKMDEAKALKQRIGGGQISFADAARKYSIGPGAAQGGDLGNVNLQDVASGLRDIVANLKPGAVSDPVVIEGKPTLLTLLGQAAPQAADGQAGVPTLASVHDMIRDRLAHEKLDTQFAAYMDKLRAKAVISITL